MRYVGLDVHWRQSSICVLDSRGRKLSIQTIRGGWSKVLEELPSCCFLMRSRRSTFPRSTYGRGAA